jgi:peptide/nickel transport system substrate-binding protein
MLGWGVPTFDAMYSLQSLVRTVGSDGDGNYNVGRYSNPKIDAVIDRAKVATDPLVRTRMLREALQMTAEDVAYLPLHNQIIPWAMKRSIDMVHRPDNRIDWRLVKVN